MKILALDCSTSACSVAVSTGSEIVSRHELAAREHTQRLLPMVDKVLVDAGISLNQLDAIAFGRGPGSFTGIRICLGAVQGLAFGAQLPVVGISSLAALAQTAIETQVIADNEWLMSSFDARMDEIYWGLYRVEQGLVVPAQEDRLSKPESLHLPEIKPAESGSISDGLPVIRAVGSGLIYGERIACYDALIPLLSETTSQELLPQASALLRLATQEFEQGNYCSADKASPSYLRDEVAWQKQA
jgi:tRNA threonylcarbamoyladenosine biosynthesis protein TsaB